MNNDIFRFDIPMNNFEGMNLVGSFTDLSHNESDSGLSQGL